MPPALAKAHSTLDRAVDAAYGRRSFPTEDDRFAFLFERYQALAAPLAIAPKAMAGKRRGQATSRKDAASISN